MERNGRSSIGGAWHNDITMLSHLMTGWHNASVDATLTLWKRLPMLTVPMLHRSEVNRMTSEKASAFTDGAVAAQREMMRLGVALISGRIELQTLANASISVAAAAMQPAFRTVQANSRRFQRGK